MASQTVRMRLTIEVLPLQAENAFGPYGAAAVAAFKGRKFALPVQLEDTFEHVWSQIEERYKRNYLTPPQAASFTIKKLQDAYDCDLDLGDTVSSIFESESDPLMRTIKVIPAFVNRDFSVPPTSHLRPVNSQKRQRDSHDDEANKRIRLEEASSNNVSRDRPLPSTESEHSSDNGAGIVDTQKRLRRSRSGASVIISHDAQTGQDEFAPIVKEESPELGLPTVRAVSPSDKEPSRSPDVSFKKPLLPASASKRVPPKRVQEEAPKESLSQPSPDVDEQNDNEQSQNEGGEHIEEDVIMGDDIEPSGLEHALSPESSIEPTPEPRAAIPRSSIYDAPDSPPFVGDSVKRVRPLKTYGRNPRTPRSIQKPTSAPSEPKSREANGQASATLQSGIKARARAFQKAKPDEIVSTPQEELAKSPMEDISTSDRSGARQRPVDGPVLAKTAGKKVAEDPSKLNETIKPTNTPKVAKSSSLKKPTSKSYQMPAVPNTTNPFQARFIDPFKGRSISDKLESPALSRDKSNGTPLPETGHSAATLAFLASVKIPPNLAGDIEIVRSQERARESASLAANSNSVDKRSLIKSPSKVKSAKARESADLATKSRSVEKRPPVNSTSKGKSAKARESAESAAKSNNIDKSASVDSTGKSRVFVRRTSPKVVIPTISPSVPIENGSRRSSLDQRPRSSSSRKESASIASNLLNAFRKSGCSKENLSSNVEADGSFRANGTSDAPVTRKAPARSQIPRPDNVQHLENQGVVTNGEGSSREKGASNTSEPSPSPVVLKNRVDADDAIVISSRESSSSLDDSEEEEEEENLEEEEEEEKKLDEDEEVEEMKEIPETPMKIRNGEQISTAQSEEEPADAEENHALNLGNAEFLADPDAFTELLSEGEHVLKQREATADAADEAEPPRSPAKAPSDPEVRGDNTPQPLPWNAESWGSTAAQEKVAATQKADEEMASQSSSRSRSGSASASTTESESKSTAQSKSESASGVDSTRSSPAVARRPARFLSHSPTPNNSSSEDESVAPSPPPANAMSSDANGKEESADSGSSSSDSSSDSDESEDEGGAKETEDEDVEMEDAGTDTKAGTAPPSPQPSPQKPRRQSTSPPANAQPTKTSFSQSRPRRSEVPLPPGVEVPSTAPLPKTSSSQPQPRTPATVPRRPTYQKFPSIKQQLTAVRSTPAASQYSGKFDARTLNLSKLTKAKAQGKKGVVLGGNESSSSDESSSDDSSSEDEGVTRKGAGCSVA